MTRAWLLGACLLAAACGGEEPQDTTTSSNTGTGAGGGGGQMPVGAGAIIPCAPGELELADGTCKPPGVPVDGCGVGFTHDGDAGCDPVLPATPCQSGQLAQLGDSSCHEVAACGSSKWEGIPVDATTEYVDQSFNGTSNGSAAQPWTSVQQAINAAASGAVIAITAGNYAEDLSINKPVKLWGACTTAVSIGGSGFGDAILVSSAGSNSEVHRVSLSGAGSGVTIQSATVLLDQVYIHDTTYNAINAYRSGALPSAVTVQDSLVERGNTVAVSIIGSQLLMEDSVVRGTLPSSTGSFGRGLSIESFGVAKSTATVRRSVIQDNTELGISVLGSDVTVEDTLIEGTVSQPSDGNFGFGIGAWQYGGVGSTVNVSRSVVRNNMGCGICGTDSALVISRTVMRDMLPMGNDELGYGARSYSYELTPNIQPSLTMTESLSDGSYQLGVPIVGGDFLIENTIIRNVKPRASDGNFGRGISPEVSYDNFANSNGMLRGVVVENTYDVGVFVVGSNVDMDSVLIKDVHSRENDGIFGAGIGYATEVLSTMSYATGTVNRAVVENCQAAGFGVAGASVTATDIIVRDTKPQTVNDDFGDGVVVSSYLVITPDPIDTVLTLTRGTVTGNARAGIAVFGADFSLMDSNVSCNAIDLDGEEIQMQAFTFEDLGGNECSCGDDGMECRLLSSGLTPPTPVGF